jgi:hypothetical protein
MPYEFNEWEHEPETQTSSSRGGGPPRKITGVGLLDPTVPPKRQWLWLATASLACIGVLWIHLNDFGASEFIGGRLTGKLFTMADAACLLFLVALLLTIFYPRVAAVVALAATLLCLPFYLYILMPGPYRQIFKGEYSVPLQRPFIWNNWTVVGVLSLVLATFFERLQSFQRAVGTCTVTPLGASDAAEFQLS